MKEQSLNLTEKIYGKILKKYVKIYKTALQANNFTDVDVRAELYKERLQEMYISEAFTKHNVYPTMDVIKIYPNTYQIAKKWNVSDHENRVKDVSITYDYFNVSEGKIEYSISKCMYIEMFEYYGIRGLCKIFCLTDETAYSNLTRHVKFTRHSDLSDGECCHDEGIDRMYIG